MKNAKLIRFVIALVGLAAVPFLPFLNLEFLGISFWGVSMFSGATGFYPIFYVPIFAALILVVLSLSDSKSIGTIAGVIVLVIHILFAALKKNVILSGDIDQILQIASGVISRFNGDVTDLEAIKVFLEPLLGLGIGFYLAIAVDIVYIISGALITSKKTPRGKGSSSYTTLGGSGSDSSSSGRYTRI